MHNRYFIVSALLVLFATPAVAASYYISQDVKTKVCSVTTQPPDGTTHVQVGYSTFSTHQDATIAMNATQECVSADAKNNAGKK